MLEWIRENFSWLSMLIIAGIAKIISSKVWFGSHPISIYLATFCLAALVFLSFCYLRFIERLILFSAYLWVCWSIINIFSAIYLKYGITGEATTPQNTLYLSISIWTLLGFGPILPTEASRFWVQIEAIMGLLANGALVALLVRLFSPWQQLINNNR